MPECQKLIDWMEEWASPAYAEEGDRIGLQVGSPSQWVERVLVTLELTAEVLEEAVARGVQLILSHHPLIYQPLTTLRSDQPPASLITNLIRNEISFFAAHTNLDAAPGGVSDLLAEALDLEQVQVLVPNRRKRDFKLVVFVPEPYLDQVRRAICSAGAGGEGLYSECTFRTAGIGTFRPHPGATPFIGKAGQLEQVNEARLETILPEERISEVVSAMLEAHPYQEVAYDLYPLANGGRVYGLGRIGVLRRPAPLAELALLVKERLGLAVVRVTGEPGRMISRVALCGGSAMEFLPQALASGADLYLTGDVKHHQALEAAAKGIALIDAGHYGSERIVIPAMVQYLREKAEGEGELLQVFASEVVTDPFACY